MIGPIGNYTRVPIAAVASSGTTAAQLVAAAPGLEVIPWSLTIRNADTVWHTVTFLDGTAGMYALEVPPGQSFALDNPNGYLRTTAGNALQFKIDSGGTGSTVTVSGGALR
jgi:hypothetical protein